MTATVLDPVVKGPASVPRDLLVAVVLGDCARVETELSRIGASRTVLTRCGRLAAANGQRDVLHRLLNQGFPADDAEALKCAAAAGWSSILEMLHARGAKLEPSADLVRTAARGGHLEALRYLHDVGCALAPCGEIIEELKARPTRAPVVDYLLANGVRAVAMPAPTVVDASSSLQAQPAQAAQATTPGISVLLANYNDSVFLRTSLEALAAQTRMPEEIIIVDDGSTDDSIEVIERFIRSFGRARLIRHHHNLGQHAAVQRALAAASHDYILWTSADDLLLPRFIERSAAVLTTHPGIGLCFSRLCSWREGSRRIRQFTRALHGDAFDLGSEVRAYSPAELREHLKRSYLWISGNTVVARRDALLAIGGFESKLRWHADWFAYYAVALRHGACSIPETLAIMREREETFSRVGMLDDAAQRAVLRSIVDVLSLPANEDLRRVFRRRPSLFSPFGRKLLLANLPRPQSWPLLAPYFFWLLPRKVAALIKRARRMLSVWVWSTFVIVWRRARGLRALLVPIRRWHRRRRLAHRLAVRARAAAEESSTYS